MIYVSLIAAYAKNCRVIGAKGVMPWHLPKDLQYFKRKTIKKPVIMGRVTWDALGRFRPLVQRKNIVLTRNDLFLGADCSDVLVKHSLKDGLLSAYQYCLDNALNEIMVIGGGCIYQQALPYAHRLYLTQVDASDIQGDAYFPEISFEEWDEDEDERLAVMNDAMHEYSFTHFVYNRKESAPCLKL